MEVLWVSVILLFAQSGHSAPKASTLSKHPKLILWSYDGFRFDYMTKTDTPNLDFLKAGGVSSPYLIPQFPSYTFPNHHSISTGLHTQTHGVVSNTVWDPDLGRKLGSRDPELWRSNDQITPFWIVNEWAGDDRISGVQFPGSDFGYGANRSMPVHYLDYPTAEKLTFEERVDYVMAWLTDEAQPANMIYMYFNEPDSAGHKCGPNSVEVARAIQRVDNATGYILDKLRERELLDEVNLIFLGDHGMEEVSHDRVIDFKSLADPGSYDIYSHTPVIQIWPHAPENTDNIYNGFKAGSLTANFSVYMKADLPVHWHYGGSRRVPPITLVADAGYLFNDYADGSEHCENKQVWGKHGYDPLRPGPNNMRTYFIAHGPAFKKGVQIEPFQNVDIFPLLCHIMGIPPPGNNGTLKNVIGALRESPDSNTGSNTLEVPKLQTIGWCLLMLSLVPYNL